MLQRLGFRHGVHPPESKELTERVPIRRMPFPEEIVLPLRQHAGKPAKAVVKPGDRVETGTAVGRADPGDLGVDVHSSIEGTVTAVTDGYVEIRA